MSTINTIRKVLLAALLSLLACLQAATADSLPKTLQFDIAPQTLTEALIKYSEQSGIQVSSPSQAIDGKASAGVVGAFSAAEALKRLLGGTGLYYDFIDATTVAVRIAPARTNAQTTSFSRDGKQVEDVNLAQANQAMQKVENNSSNGTEENKEQDQSSNENSNQKNKGIPEVLVRGSRTINADIRRTEDAPQPYVVFAAEEIRQSGVTTLEEFFRRRLPMNTLSIAVSQAPGTGLGSQSAVNLRGLGSNQTLILVDGRRMAGVASSVASGQSDINGIPMASVERIEVLPSTASGIYGGGATGGVINIITRKDYTGIDVSLTYGNTFRADAGNHRFDGSAGFSLNDGRTQLFIAASHAAFDRLLVGERNFVARGRALQLANNPSAFFAVTTPPFGYTSNIRSQDGSNLVLDSGAALNSPITFVPIGYAGPASDNGAALVANAGRYNLDLPAEPNGDRQSLLVNPTVNSASVNLRQNFGERTQFFADLSWHENRGPSYSSVGAPNTVTLPGTAANNPFTMPVVVRFPVIGLEFPTDAETETRRATGGVIVRLPHSWTVSADHVWSEVGYWFEQTNPAVGDPDGTGPEISVSTALSNGILNVMRDLNTLPLNWTPYLLRSPTGVFGPADTVLHDTNLRLSGPFFHGPAGPFTLSALAGYRREEGVQRFSSSTNSNNITNITFVPSRSQTARSYYLEAQVPLVAEENASWLGRVLELQASIRRDDYDTEAGFPASFSVPSREGPLPSPTYTTNETGSTEYTFGVRYSPLRDLVLRASYGTGFLPPAMNQIAPANPQIQSIALTDPKRGSVSATVGPFTQFSGGNPDLAPENSKSWSAGVIVEPRFFPGVRLSLDYTRIEKNDEIFMPTSQDVLNLEDFLPGRVVRAALTPADQILGYTGGVITSINAWPVNFSKTRLEAYDLQVDYTAQTARFGSFHFYTVQTKQPHLERQILPLGAFSELVGFSSSPLKWRGNAGLNWQRGPWTLGWNCQYYHSHYIYAAGSLASTITTATLSQGSATIPRQVYHDVFGRYRFNGSAVTNGVLGGLEISLGIQNLSDKQPPILATTAATGGYSRYADPRMRLFTLTIHKTF